MEEGQRARASLRRVRHRARTIVLHAHPVTTANHSLPYKGNLETPTGSETETETETETEIPRHHSQLAR